MGAPILEREVLAAQVVDAEGDRARVDDLDRARQQLVHRTDVQQSHYLRSSSSAMPAHSSGSGVPFALWSASFSVERPSSAHFRRTGVSGMPISSSSSSRGSVATSIALLPLTISVSIDVAACEIAQPRPENLTSSMVSPSSPKPT